jgi:hypothetical protein
MEPANLQAAVEKVERAIDGLSQGFPESRSALHIAWSQLVRLLAPEPARATRECPRCGNVGMREATLCGYCWKKLVPPGHAERVGLESVALRQIRA